MSVQAEVHIQCAVPGIFGRKQVLPAVPPQLPLPLPPDQIPFAAFVPYDTALGQLESSNVDVCHPAGGTTFVHFQSVGDVTTLLNTPTNEAGPTMLTAATATIVVAAFVGEAVKRDVQPSKDPWLTAFTQISNRSSQAIAIGNVPGVDAEQDVVPAGQIVQSDIESCAVATL